MTDCCKTKTGTQAAVQDAAVADGSVLNAGRLARRRNGKVSDWFARHNIGWNSLGFGGFMKRRMIHH